jgi:glutathione S-transferase
MNEATLVIGDKNLSSWSLRAWLALRHAGISFREEIIRLDRPETRDRIRAFSPSGRVPVLVLGDHRIWESLAICEWAGERVPSLWPSDPVVRATARSVSAEMHAGFTAMRGEMPMNIKARTPKKPSDEARADIDRILSIWRECRTRFASQGEYLFGQFSIADCMFAPVITRFHTYGIPLDDVSGHYAAAILAHPGMVAWYAAAEHEV